MLALRNVDVVFDGVIQVLRSLSLEVMPGQVVALMGGNGAGKTTTLKAVSSLLAAERGAVTGGHVWFAGQEITNGDPGAVVRAGAVQVMEGRRVLHHLTVEQNLRVGAHFRTDRAEVAADLEAVYRYFPRLKDLRERTAGFLSGGEMQMLLVGRALMARPVLLLLDEPSMGLAPRIVHELFERIAEIRHERRMSVLLVEQNARAALRISDYGYVMENGRIVLHGTREDLERNEDIREFYLGLGGADGRRSYREVKHYKRRKRWLG
ncbi:ABC transporter ATP-binding protein [Caldimonas thermodepolymerans]|uniref:ABC transporter ATP-binding protein n=1 Tax=Caldimonas thermodepolymerans TaxID=215580 RepID=A0A2S5T5R9_9BURK|nr:ABC transporter ATP-binding protein [Caldimonas thermodepolymerans]